MGKEDGGMGKEDGGMGKEDGGMKELMEASNKDCQCPQRIHILLRSWVCLRTTLPCRLVITFENNSLLYVQSRHPLPSHATHACLPLLSRFHCNISHIPRIHGPAPKLDHPPPRHISSSTFIHYYYYYYSQLTSLQTPAWPLSQLFKPSLSHQ